MASSADNTLVDTAGLKGPAKEFIAFCETERAHRRNADPDFDPRLFDDAMRLVLERLAVLKKETQV
jgi:hypothetical protein